MLGPTELKNSDESSYVCTDKNGGAQILLWDLTRPAGSKISDQEIFFQPQPARGKGKATVQLKNLSAGKYRQTIYRIGYHENDPYSRYLEMGSPSDLSREDVAKLKNLSAGKPVSEKTITVKSDGRFETSLPLRENDVYFLSLTPEGK